MHCVMQQVVPSLDQLSPSSVGEWANFRVELLPTASSGLTSSSSGPSSQSTTIPTTPASSTTATDAAFHTGSSSGGFSSATATAGHSHSSGFSNSTVAGSGSTIGRTHSHTNSFEGPPSASASVTSLQGLPSGSPSVNPSAAGRPPHPNPSGPRTLMFFEHPTTPLGCTVVLKGAPIVQLVKLKRVLKFALLAAYNARLETALLAGHLSAAAAASQDPSVPTSLAQLRASAAAAIAASVLQAGSCTPSGNIIAMSPHVSMWDDSLGRQIGERGPSGRPPAPPPPSSKPLSVDGGRDSSEVTLDILNGIISQNLSEGGGAAPMFHRSSAMGHGDFTAHSMRSLSQTEAIRIGSTMGQRSSDGDGEKSTDDPLSGQRRRSSDSQAHHQQQPVEYEDPLRRRSESGDDDSVKGRGSRTGGGDERNSITGGIAEEGGDARREGGDGALPADHYSREATAARLASAVAARKGLMVYDLQRLQVSMSCRWGAGMDGT